MQLYARAAADAVLEGKAAAPITAKGGNDDFVELDADGNPVVVEAEAPKKRAPAKKAPAKKPAAKKAPAKKAAAKADDNTAETSAE